MNIRKMKLATKTSLAVAIILIISLTILITISVLSASRDLANTVDGEFSGISNQNGIIVQGMIDDAASVAENLQDYLEDAYAEQDQMMASQTTFSTKKSQVYDVNLLEFNYQVENYFLHNAWSTIEKNPNILGMGLFFEPYAYDPSIRDYAIYVDKELAADKQVEPEGTYEEYSKFDYYALAAESQKVVFSDPYEESGIMMVTASFPIVSGGQIQGVILVDMDVDRFAQVKSIDEKYPTMFTNILTQDGMIVYNSESKGFVGQNLANVLGSEIYGRIHEKAQAGEAFQMESRNNGSVITQYYYPIKAGENTWWASTSLDKEDLNKVVVNLSMLMIGIALVALVVIIVAIIFLLRRMLKPIEGVVTAAEKIVRGELDIHVDVQSEDEIGVLAKAFEDMSERLKGIISEVGYLLGEMAKGNFRVKTQQEENYVGDYQDILLAMQGINQNLSSTLSEIDVAANQVTVGSEQVASSAQSLSQGTMEQASSVEELSATLVEISQRVEENADNARLASRLSHETGDGMKESNERMDQLMAAMNEIASTSAEIGKVINTIEDIAFQTNILALNAAVEAARAGTAGKGFAVVADEVRNLAGKCADSAKNTTGLIEGAIRAVENGTKHAADTAESLRTIVVKAETTDQTIQQIAKASEEQSMAITQFTAGVEQISAVVQGNSAMAEESAAASEELSGQAQTLKDLVDQFQLRKDA